MSETPSTVAARSPGLFARIALLGPGLAITAGVSLVLVVVIARYFITTLARGVPDDFAGPVVFIGVPGLAALFFVGVAIRSLFDTSWASPCPACGVDRARRFDDDLGRCANCLAYLRHDRGRIAEESPSHGSDARPYRIPKAELGGRTQLEAARCCGFCGSDEVTTKTAARHQKIRDTRDIETGLEGIGVYIPGKGGGGEGSGVYNKATHGNLPSQRASSEPLRLQLVYGLCHKHAGNQGDVAYDDDEVKFRNYRCYRETLRANGIGPR